MLVSTAKGLGSELTAYPLSGGAPYSVYTTTINVSHLAAAPAVCWPWKPTPAGRIWRARPEPAAAPDIIDPVNGKTWAHLRARRTLAFLSNRSGNNGVWVMKPRAAPAMLFDAGLAPVSACNSRPTGRGEVTAAII